MFLFLTAVNTYTVSAQRTVFSRDSAKGKTYAVIVGITNYKDPAIPALQFADKDAQQFSAFLQSKGGGQVPVNHIKLIVNKDATIAAIYDALDWLKEQCHKGDLAYIYLSCHGDVETKNNFSKGFLLAYNSPQNNYANNAIRVEDLNNTSLILTTRNKAKVILISDACHSGKLAGDFYKGKQLVASQLNLVLNNQVRLASCAENEEAAEGPDWGGGRGVFSYYLIMGLQGLADMRNDKTIELRDLTKYLDSSFAIDKYLIENKHIQNPVTDGNPNYPLAKIDSATVHSLMATIKNNRLEGSHLPPGLMALKPLQPQPIDYFFSTIAALPFESILNFDSYLKLDAATLPLKMVNDCIIYQDSLSIEKAAATKEDPAGKNYTLFSLYSLNLLKNQLSENKSINSLFVEKFIQSVHDKGQDMIGAYLNGDLDELERRQYYYSGKRDYTKYLSMLHIALNVVPESHRLSRILQINNFYLTGLIDRMLMATSSNIDSLLDLAFYNQQQACKMEPYAAYILNELGNLYLYKNNYDSAKYNFDLASVISPKWAIPWSNKIRLNMVLKKFNEAEQDFRTADSLQPNQSYVFTNVGMAMEKKGNLLSAESYYLRAIKENNVHFFPFEHLGYLYLSTADYDKANYYLYETEIRKQNFVINDKAFDYSIVSDVDPDFEEKDAGFISCPQKLIAKNETVKQYIDLINGLKNLDNSNAAVILLQKLANKNPHIPLANHYLGKKYYHSGKWELARDALEISVSNYLSNVELIARLAKDIFGTKLSSEDSCQLKYFLRYQYDALEDHYLLAALYKKSKDYEKAFAQYNAISSIENLRQLDQATFSALKKKYGGSAHEIDQKVVQKLEEFILMGGSIKAARLYESLNKYEKGEKILLRQVALSRAAGNARQEVIKEKGWDLRYRNKDYWLSINSYLETEIHNFYKKALESFPRDPIWQQKAGLFLYNRLESSFKQVPVDQYNLFYYAILSTVYSRYADDNLYVGNRSVIPGTDEILTIPMSRFDPVKEAVDAINLSVKLSADILPQIEAAKALADLYFWLSDEEKSIYWFQQSIALDPGNEVLRNKFLACLKQFDHLFAAYKQLDSLNQEKKVTREQKIQLMNWKWLAGEDKEAYTLINNFSPIDQEEKRLVLLLKGKMSMLSGDSKSALQILLDTTTINKSNVNNYPIQIDKKRQNNDRLYTIARLYAFLQKDDDAFDFLKMAIDSGFKNEYVIYYDKAWTKLRGTETWNKIIKNPPTPLKEPPPPDLIHTMYMTPFGLK